MPTRSQRPESGKKSLLSGPVQASLSVGAFAASTPVTSSLYRYAVAREIPNPALSWRMSGWSRNHAKAASACFQQVRARVPSRVPISSQYSAAEFE